MADREKVIEELDKLVDEVNPWKENPPLRCDILYQLLCDALALLKEQEAIIEQYHRADGFLAAHGWSWEGQ